MILLKLIFFLWLCWCIFWTIVRKHQAIEHIKTIKNEKIRQLYWAVYFGRKKKIDKLVKEGVDLNYQVPLDKDIKEEDQRRTTTVLAWLLLHNSLDSPLTKSMYCYLLKKGASPLIPTVKFIPHIAERITMAQYVAERFRSYYVRKMLEIAKPDPKEMNMVEDGSIPIVESLFGDNYKNYKLLLNYGVYPRRGYILEEDGSISREYTESTFLSILNNSGSGFRKVYLWIKQGLDYSDKDKDGNGLKEYLENFRDGEGLRASNRIDFDHGVDYLPKVLELLEKDGIKINLKIISEELKRPEKYITKNGKMVLHIQTKNGKWKPYHRTWRYISNKYWGYSKARLILKAILLRCQLV